MSERWVSGYRGEDSLRSKAHKMLGIEQKGARYGIPESMSSPGHTKMRPYAEGGHAEGGAMKRGGRTKHHKLSHDQTDLHIPRRAKVAPIVRMSKEKAEHLKRGGTPKLNVESVKEFEHMKRGGKSHHKHHFAEGGHAEGGALKKGGHAHHTAQHKHHAERAAMHKKELANLNKIKHEIHEESNYRHGGHAKHKHHYAEGGINQVSAPFTPNAQTAVMPSQPGFKKGGHMKHKHHKASGGTIYEHQMVGEKPSRKAHGFNYESEMKGERPVRKPSSKHESKKGLTDKNHGQLFAEGGKATGGAMKRGGHSHHKAAGGETKMAAGGVGKIRHNAATASGKPKGAGRVIRNNLF